MGVWMNTTLPLAELNIAIVPRSAAWRRWLERTKSSQQGQGRRARTNEHNRRTAKTAADTIPNRPHISSNHGYYFLQDQLQPTSLTSNSPLSLKASPGRLISDTEPSTPCCSTRNSANRRVRSRVAISQQQRPNRPRLLFFSSTLPSQSANSCSPSVGGSNSPLAQLRWKHCNVCGCMWGREQAKLTLVLSCECPERAQHWGTTNRTFQEIDHPHSNQGAP